MKILEVEHGANRGAVPGDCNIGESKGENGVLLRELLNDANALTASCSDISLLSVLLYCQLQVFKEMISSQIQQSLLLSNLNCPIKQFMQFTIAILTCTHYQ